jgi:hypothetical protein
MCIDCAFAIITSFKRSACLFWLCVLRAEGLNNMPCSRIQACVRPLLSLLFDQTTLTSRPYRFWHYRTKSLSTRRFSCSVPYVIIK